MGKIKIFLDVDNTITSSTETFCSVYNSMYKYHSGFIPAQWEKTQKWNFEDTCPLLQSESGVLRLFEGRKFFSKLKFINDNTYDVIKRLNEKYQIIIVSIGTPRNLSLKSEWLHIKLPFIKSYVLLYNEGCKMDKELVRMNYPDSIFIDDVTTNLDSSNAVKKYIFGTEYPWSQTNDYQRLFTWSDIERELL